MAYLITLIAGVSTLIGYLSASGLSYAIEYVIYVALINTIFNNKFNPGLCILLSTLISRAFSSVVNYTLNKEKVFKTNKGLKKTLIEYYTLVLIQGLVSSGIITVLYKLTNINTSIIKILVDSVLSFFSYKIQLKWIFNKE